MDRLFVDRLQHLFKPSAESVMASFSGDKLPTFRVNTLVVAEDVGIARLAELGVMVEKVDAVPLAYVLKNKTKREFTDLEEYKQGWFYLQSLSSMVPVSLLKDYRQKTIDNRGMVHALDMCAAPGSKTSQLAAYLGEDGEIFAHDVSRQRIFQMKSVLKQLHVSNVLISQSDASMIWKKYGPIFDIVLLDAPCSGEGRFKFKTIDNRQETIDEPEWSMKNIERMASIQKRLIFSAIMCLKQGGTLVYSTCTFAPEENEAVVDFALKKFEGAIEIETIDLARQKTIDDRQKNIFEPGVTEWNGEHFDPRVVKAVRIRPDSLWDGFFVCKIHRN